MADGPNDWPMARMAMQENLFVGFKALGGIRVEA
jgi:hypothetical protein